MPIKRIAHTLRELGTTEATIYFVGRLLSGLSAGRLQTVRYHIVAQPVPAAVDRPRPSTTCLVRQITSDDPVVARFPRPTHVIARRFEQGSACFVAENGGRFAGFLWLARNAYEEDEVRCCYELASPESCAWDYDVYVEPEFRIGRTFSRLWDAANAHLASQGVRWSLSRISAFNSVSLAAHRRLGIRHLTTATFIVAGPLQLSVLGQMPYLHLGTGARNRPRLVLRAPEQG